MYVTTPCIERRRFPNLTISRICVVVILLLQLFIYLLSSLQHFTSHLLFSCQRLVLFSRFHHIVVVFLY